MRTLTIIATAALLAACTTPADTAGAPSFGASVAANHDAQVIPNTPAAGAPEGHAAIGAAAVQRYKDGAVRPLSGTSTSSLVTGS